MFEPKVSKAGISQRKTSVVSLYIHCESSTDMIHAASHRSSRVARIVLAAGLRWLTKVFDGAGTMLITHDFILGMIVDTEATVDRKSLFETVATLNCTKEK